MWTQEVYQDTIKFAGEAHSNQTMQNGDANYLLHLSNVAMEVFSAYHYQQNFDIDLSIQLALLHDTIEDSGVSVDELTQKFGEKVALGVLALTKDNDLPKEKRLIHSIERIKSSYKEVGLVKLADRITNLQCPPKHWSQKKRKKYQKQAHTIMVELGDCNEYLKNRLQKKILDYNDYLV